MALLEMNENSLKFEADVLDVYKSFDEMGLNESILRGVYSYGFEKPSIIQQMGIVPMMSGKDIIAQAQSGTGKTGTFTISILHRIVYEELVPQAMIIVPTRELAQQIKKVMSSIGEYSKVKVLALIGGTDIRSDIYALKDGVHVIVGTPGRIYDMINRGNLNLAQLKVLVLDEADQMLDRGFKDQIYEIFKTGIPKETQIALFSATWTKDSEEISKKFMTSPARIMLQKENLTLEGIKQYKILLKKEEFKFGVLLDIYQALSLKQTIIYCNNKKKVEDLALNLTEHKMSMTVLHGDMSQTEREKIMTEFHKGSVRILITTDLLARGIDVQQLSLVINYDIPNNRENYIHRIGRTGRFGRKGVALNFVTEKEESLLKDIETFYNTVVQDLPDNLSGIFDV
jgi:translation initiation factor 4A